MDKDKPTPLCKHHHLQLWSKRRVSLKFKCEHCAYFFSIGRPAYKEVTTGLSGIGQLGHHFYIYDFEQPPGLTMSPINLLPEA